MVVLRLFDVARQRCSASVQAACEPIISSSLLQVTAWNKHEWTLEETVQLTEMYVSC